MTHAKRQNVDFPLLRLWFLCNQSISWQPSSATRISVKGARCLRTETIHTPSHSTITNQQRFNPETNYN
jgi:hypothetical protein